MFLVIDHIIYLLVIDYIIYLLVIDDSIYLLVQITVYELNKTFIYSLYLEVYMNWEIFSPTFLITLTAAFELSFNLPSSLF
jgi:hypothetical protein